MTPRWRLFPKYALLIIALVGGMLIASGATSIYFSWRENKQNLIALQAEKAQAAAVRIEQYILDIEHQLGWTTLPALGQGADPFEPRRTEYQKLFRLVPAITEVAWLDPTGHEQVRISRLAMNVDGSNIDFSQAPKFKVAKGGATYYGPVYFRKDTEPYMTIARPAGLGGGVTAAEVNLKFVWEVVSRIRIGEKGAAYVVDDGGVLIAHPDISLVLRKTDLNSLPQIAALKNRDASTASPARGIGGAPVLSAHAAIPTLHWTVFVESPEAEAFAPLYASILRAGLLLAAGLLVSMVASFFVARALVRPLEALQEGAARIGAGELDRRIEVRTGDELEGLAEQFNKMASELKESYTGLERKVAQRTSELTEALEQQTATAEILRVISDSITDTQPVFDAIVSSCQRLFAGRAVSLVLPRGAMLESVAFASDGTAEGTGGFLTPWPFDRDSGAGACILESTVIVVADTVEGATRFPRMRDLAHALGYRSGLFVPLLREGQAIGCFAVLRAAAGEFTGKEISLAQTFADQAVIAIENVRLFNETKEALNQQTATAEVLKVISSSVADAAPVFDKILESCQRLFASSEQGVLLVGEDGLMHLGAHHGGARERLQKLFPVARDVAGEGLSREPRIAHFRDVLNDAGVPARVRAIAESIDVGTYSQVIAPMVWEGESIGSLYVIRQPPIGFSDKEIGLLRTFADQAVIAIQNARLFNETKEGLRQQTAIAGVLKVISQSTFDLDRVLATLIDNATQLCEASHGFLFRPQGDVFRLAVSQGASPEFVEHIAAIRVRPERGFLIGRVVLERRPVQILDALDDPDYRQAQSQRLGGYRTMLGVPMLSGSTVVGVIVVWRQEVRRFTDKQIELLTTFADQAVIAIENVRLFNETKEALERQTATAEVLKVISASPTDVQPVLDAVAERAGLLCKSEASRVWLLVGGDKLRAMAEYGPALGSEDELPLRRTSIVGRAFLERRLLHVEDVVPLIDTEYPDVRELQARHGFRTVLAVPMMREGQPIGAIALLRRWVQPFHEADINLVRTFADQAVIAIENTRLFNETKEALEQQIATSDVLQAISNSVADTAPVFDKILAACERLFAGNQLMVFLVDDQERLALGAIRGPDPERLERARRIFPVPLAGTATEQAIRERRLVTFADVLADPDVPDGLRRIARQLGETYSVAIAPMLWEGKAIGSILVARPELRAFDDKEQRLLRTFADQAVIAIQNARLFNEIQAKSRELEMANKHKSEFLANMSHELRTPLNAIIGFSEVLSEKMFGDVNPKQLEYLLDIHSSGHHLLSLINDILDLSKIEAGRMELDLATTSLPMLLDNCTTLVRERASRQGLVLALEIGNDVGDWVADVRKLKQVVINLLSNAVKFTPAGGRITLRARRLEHAVEIAVVDTGVGIAADQQALVFEEFRQAGGDYLRKSEGTGLGLSLSKRFVEMHGGSIRVESEPGRGSTFAFVLPERTLEAA
ncbi:MAG: GAF domain-containing protein [Caldimonas sp.]